MRPSVSGSRFLATSLSLAILVAGCAPGTPAAPTSGGAAAPAATAAPTAAPKPTAAPAATTAPAATAPAPTAAAKPATGGAAAPASTAAAAPAVNNDPAAILKYGSMQAQSLDPIRIGNACDVTVEWAIYDTLVFLDDKNAPQPGLAESWSLPDASHLVLKVRQGVKFQDGTSLDAAAVKFNLDRAKNDAASTIKGDLALVKSVDVVDPMTVQLTLDPPAPASILPVLAGRAGMIASPTAVQAAGSSDAFSKNPVGAGMYKISGDWRPQEAASVRAWDGYWNKRAALLGGIDFTDTTPDATLNALRSGDLTMSSSIDDAATAKSALQDGKLGGITTTTNEFRIFVINSSMAPFDKLEVRQALQYAVDRVGIAAAMTGGTAEPAWSGFPKGTLGYNADLATLYPHDAQKAKDLLAKAGYPNGVSFNAAIGRTSTSYVQMGQLVQASLKDAGFNMQLDLIEPAQVVPSLYRGGANGHGSLQASPLGMFATADPDILVRNRYLASAPFNAGGVEAPGVKGLADEAVATTDRAKRDADYQQIAKIIDDQALDGVPLYFVQANTLYQPYVGGVTVAHSRCNDTFRGVYVTQGKVPVKQ